MSHFRNLGGGRRDANEPEIMKRFLCHGWHPEQVSGNRLWDLNVYPSNQPAARVSGAATHVFHVDVKTPDGKVTKPQEEKWKALAEKGIPVYVVRTAEDVDALVRGELAAWAPTVRCSAFRCRSALPCAKHSHPSFPKGEGVVIGKPPFQVRVASSGYAPPRTGADRLKGCGCKRSLGRCEHSGPYTPPRSKPVDAAKEADETFTPCACTREQECAACSKGGAT